ncbi:hypothetical protein F6Q10_35275, partial [Streptomyces vinaceus]|nr:hypothetical protein [Streptomyces vinaceus]
MEGNVASWVVVVTCKLVLVLVVVVTCKLECVEGSVASWVAVVTCKLVWVAGVVCKLGQEGDGVASRVVVGTYK